MNRDHDGGGRRLWAALHLLDRQLVDRDGRMAGCVDDLEVTAAPDGSLYVSAILSGPGVLAGRLGAQRFGRWRRRSQQLWHRDDDGEATDPSRIPFNRVRAIGSHIDLAANREEFSGHATERWTREHIIDRLHGSDHAPQ